MAPPRAISEKLSGRGNWYKNNRTRVCDAGSFVSDGTYSQRKIKKIWRALTLEQYDIFPPNRVRFALSRFHGVVTRTPCFLPQSRKWQKMQWRVLWKSRVFFFFFDKGFSCVSRSPAHFDRLASFSHCTSRVPETLVLAALKPFISRTKCIACKLYGLVVLTALKKPKRSASAILDSPTAGFLQHYNDRSATCFLSADERRGSAQLPRLRL